MRDLRNTGYSGLWVPWEHGSYPFWKRFCLVFVTRSHYTTCRDAPWVDISTGVLKGTEFYPTLRGIHRISKILKTYNHLDPKNICSIQPNPLRIFRVRHSKNAPWPLVGHSRELSINTSVDNYRKNLEQTWHQETVVIKTHSSTAARGTYHQCFQNIRLMSRSSQDSNQDNWLSYY